MLASLRSLPAFSRTNSQSSSKPERAPWLWYLILGGLVAAFYFPAVLQVYLFADDHPLLKESLKGTLDAGANAYLRDGRPLTGWFLTTAVNSFSGFEGFIWLRLYAGCTTVLFCLMLFHTFRRTIGDNFLPFILSLTIVTSPSFAIYVGWASCFLYPTSAILAFLAGKLVIHNARQPFGWKVFIQLLLAILLFVSAFSIYQITALFFLVPFIVYYFGQMMKERKGGVIRREIKLNGLAIAVGVLSIGIYLKIVQFLKLKYFSNQPQLGERGFAALPEQEFIGKYTHEIFDRVLPGWIYIWDHLSGLFFSASVIVLALLILVGSGYLALQRKKWGNFVFGLFFTLANLVPFLALLFIDQKTFPWRLFAVCYAGFLILFAGSVKISSLRTKPVWHWLILGICGLYAFVQYGMGYDLFRKGMVEPNVEEVELFRELGKDFSPENNDVYVICIPVWYLLQDERTNYEYAFHKSGVGGWFTQPSVFSLLASQFGRFQGVEKLIVVVVPFSGPKAKIDRVAVIETEQYYGEKFAVPDYRTHAKKIQLEGFGQVYQFTDYVYYSDVLGYVIKYWQGWYYNPALHYILPLETTEKELWFSSDVYGKIMVPLDKPLGSIWIDEKQEWLALEHLTD